MRTSAVPFLCLSTIAAAVLSSLAGGCCMNVDEEVVRRDYDGAVAGADLQMVHENETDAEDRCAAACRVLADREDDDLDRILECTAVGNEVEDPWQPTNTQVSISCTGELTVGSFCTGRRPQGHREVEAAAESRGRWLALHAHLERASVRAFEELAEWLSRRGAPAELVARCRAAAQDEIVHADLMTTLAHREGGDVPACEADAPADDLRAVALHNAVEGCVHEAFAAIVVRRQARAAAQPELRDVFARIADDELAHGQLAWDLHAWLMGSLDEEDRRVIARAQADALARLPQVIADNARATPGGLGWPSPEDAKEMAARFAGLVHVQLEATRGVVAIPAA